MYLLIDFVITFLYKNFIIYFWLHWVFVVAHRLQKLQHVGSRAWAQSYDTHTYLPHGM